MDLVHERRVRGKPSGREDHGFRFDLIAAFRGLYLDSVYLLTREEEILSRGLGS